MSNSKLKVGLLFLLVLGFTSPDVWARGSFLDEGASHAQVLQALRNTRSISKKSPIRRVPAKSSRAGPKSSRGVKSGRRSQVTTRQPLPASTGDPQAGPASFRLQFRINSARLDPKTIPVLDKIGEVLQREELQDFAFVVEGHTDASGSETYNRELSWQRAEAVRNYLVRKHGVDEKRLAIHGVGESRPMEGTNPYAAINRRVTFSAPAASEAAPSAADRAPTAPEDSR